MTYWPGPTGIEVNPSMVRVVGVTIKLFETLLLTILIEANGTPRVPGAGTVTVQLAVTTYCGRLFVSAVRIVSPDGQVPVTDRPDIPLSVQASGPTKPPDGVVVNACGTPDGVVGSGGPSVVDPPV